MVTTTASRHQRDAGTADVPASRVGTKSKAWRGGGAAGPPSGDPATPPRAARHPPREPASSLSVDTEPRTRARGERRGEIDECQKSKVVTTAEGRRGVLFSRYNEGKADYLIPPLSAPGLCQVAFLPCKFKGHWKKKQSAVTSCLYFPALHLHAVTAMSQCVPWDFKHFEWVFLVLQ